MDAKDSERSSSCVSLYSNFPCSNKADENIKEKPEDEPNDANPVKKHKSTFPFGNCRVCDDIATGSHYGVSTCEGCKGFFKRVSAKKDKPRCFFGNECPITPENRNTCKSCRFNKCLKVGMSIEGVKMGRIPKAEKERALQAILKDSIENHKPTYVNSAQISISRVNYNEPMEKLLYELELSKTYSFNEVEAEIIDVIGQSQNGFEELLQANPTKFIENATEEAIKSNETFNSTFPDLNPASVERLIDTYDEDFTNANDNDIYVEESLVNQLIPSTDSNQQRFYGSVFSNDVSAIINALGLNGIRIHTRHSKPFVSGPNTDSCLFTALINDKVYQLFNEKHSFEFSCYERALMLIKFGVKVFDGQDASMQEITQGIVESMRHATKSFVLYLKEMPSFSQLSKHDFTTMICKRVYYYIMLKNSFLYIDGEYYWRLPNGIHYSRALVRKIIGDAFTDFVFNFEAELNSLMLTRKELALTLSLVVSQPGSFYENPDLFQLLNDYYKRAVLYEFDINKRDDSFLERWNKILDKMNMIHKTQDDIIKNNRK